MKINIESLKIEMARKLLNGPDLAKKAEVSYSGISYILSGRRNPSIKLLGRIAKALEVDVKDLLDE